jgi:hypothetical protein
VVQSELDLFASAGVPTKDYEAKMFQAISMTTFSPSLFVRQRVQAKEHKEEALRNKNLKLFLINLNQKTAF